jgi:hypothetical protein
VVVNAWTSIGYYSPDDDLNISKQASQLSIEGAILIVVETMHTKYLSIKFAPTSYAEINNLVLLEDSKYNHIRAGAKTACVFYNKWGENLEFVDRVEFKNHIYSPNELSSLLKWAG